MNTIASEKSYSWISRFAIEHVASRSDLQTIQKFPHDIWQKMSEAGFFKIGISPKYGGNGGGFRQLTEAGEVFVRSGYNMGLALSWLYQQIIATRVISAFGNEKQLKQYLPLMAQGKLIVSFAVSEPKHGAHPKLLTSSAVPEGIYYKINADKIYLTNAPIADLFIIIAMTGIEKEQKKFSAFLVSTDNSGVIVKPQMKFDFLKPAPHGGIKMQDCLVPASALLGDKDTAYTNIVVPFSDAESVVLMGAVTGGMGAELMDLIMESDRRNIHKDKALQSEVGALDSLLETMRAIARDAAQKLDEQDSAAVPLIVTFKELVAGFQARISAAVAKWEIKTRERYNVLQADINVLGALQEKTLQAKQAKLGDELLHGAR
ncbi:butyryl-coa dehydrogenase [hydrocarbon metagenome]|uniref:Butyryl-coa dehydrogenase n=1 Tax=hydrocarbon metagenome TaxID=938273 RepID=A0A0W8FQZ5_9ZZZZ